MIKTKSLIRRQKNDAFAIIMNHCEMFCTSDGPFRLQQHAQYGFKHVVPATGVLQQTPGHRYLLNRTFIKLSN